MTDRRTFLRTTLLGLPLAAAGEAVGGTSTGKLYRKPVVVSTWDNGLQANAAAWNVLKAGGHAIDSVEQAARSAEDEASCCVGLGAHPDRDGVVTLDASIMDHKANCGGVAFLREIKHPISVARKVMESTSHVFLVGEGALRFAIANGFERDRTGLSPEAEKAWKRWLRKSDYKPVINIENARPGSGGPPAPPFLPGGKPNHDTMGTIALDRRGNLSGACTTSGMAFKMHGRVGDSPIIGAGLFVDNKVGAATSSGVGEEVIRICGTHLIIELMRFGYSPQKACMEAVRRIVDRDPAAAQKLQVGFIALSKTGEVGAYSVQRGFTYSVTNASVNETFRARSHFRVVPVSEAEEPE